MIEPVMSYLLGNCSYSEETQYLAFDSESCLMNGEGEEEGTLRAKPHLGAPTQVAPTRQAVRVLVKQVYIVPLESSQLEYP